MMLRFACLVYFYATLSVVSLASQGVFPAKIGFPIRSLNQENIQNQNILKHISEELTSGVKSVFSEWRCGNVNNICSWRGIYCLTTSPPVITSINLTNSKIVGVLPSELGQLTTLTYLSLASNKFYDSIPSSLGYLTKLSSLHLQNNKFQLTIPSTFQFLENLQELDLSNNKFAGEIPSAIQRMTSLEILKLNDNNFNAFQTKNLSNLINLEYIDISNNIIDDLISNLLSKISTNIQFINTSNNRYSNKLPSQLYSLVSLTYLSLANNILIGTISSQIGLLTSLKSLNLEQNKFSNRIPIQLYDVTSISSLNFNSNKFTGSISDSISKLIELKTIDFSTNSLKYALPLGLFKLAELDTLLISGNDFTGSISPTITQLTSLTTLDMSENSLIGSIPSIDSTLSKLKSIQLTKNKLTGAIPTSICVLTSITALDFSYNSLTQQLPTCIGSLNSLKSLTLGTNKLSSSLPVSISKLAYLTSLDFSGNLLTGTLPDSLWKLANLTTVYLQENSFNGFFPANTFRKLHYLQNLDLSYNAFTKTLPSSLGALTALQSLLLDYNSFTGQIPPSLSSLLLLTRLYLSKNRLTGGIPSELGLVTNLRDLHLNHNQLTGTLPTTLGKIQGLIELHIEHNVKLQGVFPYSFCETDLGVLYMYNTSLTCYPSCLQVQHNDFDAVIPHCYDAQDIGLCNMASYLVTSKIVKYLTFVASPVTYESSHPRYQYDSSGKRQNILVSVPNAIKYEITFDPQSQTLCSFSFSTVSTCTNAYASYDGKQQNWPGVGNNPELIITNSLFYICVPDLYCAGPNYEWGYRLTVVATTRGAGWECTTPPARTLVNPVAALTSSFPTYAASPCSWSGISCTGVSQVVNINVKAYGVKGTIPSSLGSLTAVTELDLSFNILNGYLPSQLGDMSSLQIMNFGNNGLLGSIPVTFQKLHQLSSLTLLQNSLNGTLPIFLSTLSNLNKLDLSSNNFEGKVFNELSKIALSPQNATVYLTNNPKLTCYESSWTPLASSVFDGTIHACAPTSVPTSAPTAPTLSPTTVARIVSETKLSAGAISGIVIAVVVVCVGIILLLFVLKRMMKKSPEEVRKREILANLPLHKAIYDNKELTEDFIRAHISTANELDHQDKTVVDLILERGESCRVTSRELYILVEDSLTNHFQSSSSLHSSIDDTVQNDTWAKLIQMDDQRSVDVVQMILNRYKPFIKLLAFGKDLRRRSTIDIASLKNKELISRKLYLYDRYEIGTTYEHSSSTCQVWIGKYHPLNEPNSGESTTVRKIALKFMKYRDQFLCELDSRRDGNFDNQYVIGIMSSYDGEADDQDNLDFRNDAMAKGFEDYPYCIVMDGADQNLGSMILNNFIAGRDWDEIKLIMKHVLTALDHMHSHGIVHGDLKPKNIVVLGHTFKLIDLDASASISRSQFIGAKYSSLYAPPELLYQSSDGLIHLRTYSREAVTHSPIGEYPYDLVQAAASYDMWAAGVLLYFLCTGSPMFLSNNHDNIVEQRDLRLLYEWDDETKYQKIARVTYEAPETYPGEIEVTLARLQNFLSLLLYKDATKRPSARRALDHPFLSGKNVVRLLDEEAEYDVFLSYRVDSDSHHAEILYDALTAAGLKVWWDKKSLTAGKNWEEGFCDGLVNSAYFVCLISRNSYNHDTKPHQNFSKLDKNSRCDNVLLEWRMALELSDRGLILGVFPIFIGDDYGPNMYSNFFRTGCASRSLPDIVVKAVEEKLIEHLDRQALGRPYRDASQSTVKRIVNDIMSNQGCLLEGDRNIAIGLICDKVVEMVYPPEDEDPRIVAVKGPPRRISAVGSQAFTNMYISPSPSVAADESKEDIAARAAQTHQAMMQPIVYFNPDPAEEFEVIEEKEELYSSEIESDDRLHYSEIDDDSSEGVISRAPNFAL